MLVTPRLYGQYRSAQDHIVISSTQARGGRNQDHESAEGDSGPVYWTTLPPDISRYVKNMLLVHQTGSVRVGEVVRYTLTYTPARDRVRPIPSHLHVRIRNTCAIALRAAYLHGPYTLYTACYPTTFNPNAKYDVEQFGEPQFEPMLKAGGSWTAKLKLPASLRAACEEPSSTGDFPENCTWIIECTSQVLFSSSAQVHYEVIVGRDERSVEVGFAGLTGSVNSTPGRLIDHQAGKEKGNEKVGPMSGVFNKAVSVLVEDTATLWNKPELPGLQHTAFHEFKPESPRQRKYSNEVDTEDQKKKNNNNNNKKKRDEDTFKEDGQQQQQHHRRHDHQGKNKKKKVHLVVITHGLHSNLGADMLYLKESIDAAAKQARVDARMRRKASPTVVKKSPIHDYTDQDPKPPEEAAAQEPATSTAPLSGGQEDIETELEDDEEEVIVRGFSGNAVKTERGIQYLGKRLAKYVLGMTYPDQPFLPVKKSLRKAISKTFTSKDKIDSQDGHESHHHSSVHYGGGAFPLLDRPYRVTSISFIGHSLGGLSQTYAIAYIHKHSPEFFQRIQPINFITLASPLLGLSNENPLYVRFALDFGLVGRTGQDLGLTWRAPTLARSGWAGMIAGIGSEKQRAPKRVDPGTKPLLRLLPSGPAHQALKMFRNRTVYSNVVNDGIVPLRTSCLLFLDWRGLGRVEKARRENGLIGTMAGWGWAELTGTNSTEHRSQWPWQKQMQTGEHFDDSDEESDIASLGQNGDAVPQPANDATSADYTASSPEAKSEKKEKPERRSWLNVSPSNKPRAGSTQDEANSPLAGFMSFFGASNPKKQKPDHSARKEMKAIKRAQTIKFSDDESSAETSLAPSPEPGSAGFGKDTSANAKSPVSPTSNSRATAGDAGEVFAPPKTSVFEAAGDLLNPPLPPLEFILDPQSRPRTIFHDRVYHPEDIPPPPIRRKSTFMQRREKNSSNSSSRKGSTISPTSASSDGPSLAAPETTTVQEIGSMPVEEKIARAYHRDLSWRKVLVRLSPDAHNNIVVRRMFANAFGWPVVKHLVDTHFADTYAALTADRREENEERAAPMDQPANAVGDEVNEQRRRKSGHGLGDDERHVAEADEEDDLVADLKSPEDTVGSMASSWSKPKTAGSIGRQDSVASSAWTDRFFEDGTDDDDSDDEARGYGGWQQRRIEAEADVDDFLHGHESSPKSQHTGKGKGKESINATGQSKQQQDPQQQPSLILPVRDVVDSPPTLSPVAGLGLGLAAGDRIKLGSKHETGPPPLKPNEAEPQKSKDLKGGHERG